MLHNHNRFNFRGRATTAASRFAGRRAFSAKDPIAVPKFLGPIDRFNKGNKSGLEIAQETSGNRTGWNLLNKDGTYNNRFKRPFTRETLQKFLQEQGYMSTREQIMQRANEMANKAEGSAHRIRRVHASSRFAGRRRAHAGYGNDMINMGVDYTLFMRMLDSAAFFSGSDDYKEALWEYFSDIGEISDGLQFFDNLFQYTQWYDSAEELVGDYDLGIEGSEEALDEYLDENDNEVKGNRVFKYRRGYLVVM